MLVSVAHFPWEGVCVCVCVCVRVCKEPAVFCIHLVFLLEEIEHTQICSIAS